MLIKGNLEQDCFSWQDRRPAAGNAEMQTLCILGVVVQRLDKENTSSCE